MSQMPIEDGQSRTILNRIGQHIIDSVAGNSPQETAPKTKVTVDKQIAESQPTKKTDAEPTPNPVISGGVWDEGVNDMMKRGVNDLEKNLLSGGLAQARPILRPMFSTLPADNQAARDAQRATIESNYAQALRSGDLAAIGAARHAAKAFGADNAINAQQRASTISGANAHNSALSHLYGSYVAADATRYTADKHAEVQMAHNNATLEQVKSTALAAAEKHMDEMREKRNTQMMSIITSATKDNPKALAESVRIASGREIDPSANPSQTAGEVLTEQAANDTYRRQGFFRPNKAIESVATPEDYQLVSGGPAIWGAIKTIQNPFGDIYYSPSTDDYFNKAGMPIDQQQHWFINHTKEGREALLARRAEAQKKTSLYNAKP